jgi:hypothetical protein
MGEGVKTMVGTGRNVKEKPRLGGRGVKMGDFGEMLPLIQA